MDDVALQISRTKLTIAIDPGLKRELVDAAKYAGMSTSELCESLLRDGLRALQRVEMEY